MAEQEEAEEFTNRIDGTETLLQAFPTSRVKKVVKLDKEINRIHSEALFLISCSAELFIDFLAYKSSGVALEKKRKIVKLEHLRLAVKRHQPTRDFLLDSLPEPLPPPPGSDQSRSERARSRSDDQPLPAANRRIEAFFRKCP